MQKSGSFLHDRSLWIYYALFFSGSIVVVYQALNWSLIGDSVNFLCLLFLLNGLHVQRAINIFENAVLLTMGYILPLLIRNSLQLSYAEAPSLIDFVRMGMVTSMTTVALGIIFTTVGYLFKYFARKIISMLKPQISTTEE